MCGSGLRQPENRLIRFAPKPERKTVHALLRNRPRRLPSRKLGASLRLAATRRSRRRNRLLQPARHLPRTRTRHRAKLPPSRALVSPRHPRRRPVRRQQFSRLAGQSRQSAAGGRLVSPRGKQRRRRKTCLCRIPAAAKSRAHPSRYPTAAPSRRARHSHQRRRASAGCRMVTEFSGCPSRQAKAA